MHFTIPTAFECLFEIQLAGFEVFLLLSFLLSPSLDVTIQH